MTDPRSWCLAWPANQMTWESEAARDASLSASALGQQSHRNEVTSESPPAKVHESHSDGVCESSRSSCFPNKYFHARSPVTR